MNRISCLLRCAAATAVAIGGSLPLHAQLLGSGRSADEAMVVDEDPASSSAFGRHATSVIARHWRI